MLRTTLAAGSGPPGSLLSADGTVACADGAIRIEELQASGRRPMAFADFARGVRLDPGFALA